MALDALHTAIMSRRVNGARAAENETPRRAKTRRGYSGSQTVPYHSGVQVFRFLAV